MGSCPIDHTVAEVNKKLEEQAPYLPQDIVQDLHSFLEEHLSQETLNETFHLLKKYDLAEASEREDRNQQLKTLIKAS